MSIKGFQVGNGTVQKYDYESLDNIPESFVEIDDTLTEEGQAADAKATGDALSDVLSAISSGSGLTADVKEALLALFEKVAYIDDDCQDLYDALELALYPPASLTNISAVFTQGQTVVYETDSLNVLKPYLVVTAHYSDSTTETITSYTLTGNLTAGTSIITVTYGGKTTTFTVTVTGALYPLENGIHRFTSTNRMLTVTGGKHFEYTNSDAQSSGTGGYINLSQVSENDESGTTASNFNRSETWFTIPAGASYQFKLTNIVLDNLSTSNYSMAFRTANSETTIKIQDRSVTTDATVSGTAAENIEVHALGMYVRNSYRTLSGDISLIVNGVAWI